MRRGRYGRRSRRPLGRAWQLAGVVAVLVLPWACLAGSADAATLTGRVTSAGEPVAGAFVAATGDHGHAAAAVADSGGAFRLTLPDGVYRLAASAPGFAAGFDDQFELSSDRVQDLVLTPSPGSLVPMGVFGGGAAVAADGTPGVFYLAGRNAGGLYRSVDWGGTWTAVNLARDDPAHGLSGLASPTTMPTMLTTSRFPGEVALQLGTAGVFYSTDYGVSWHQVAGAPSEGMQLLWGHAGKRSVLVDSAWSADNFGSSMYVADMTSASPRFVKMTTPYALPLRRIAVANGVDQPWLATVDTTGTLHVYPLVAAVSAPAPAAVLTGFMADVGGPNAIGFGGESAPGKPPAGVVAADSDQIQMTIKAPAAGSYPPPVSAPLPPNQHGSAKAGVCWQSEQELPPGAMSGEVTPNTSGSQGAAWILGCWVRDAGGTLTAAGGYGDGAAIDAGYNATSASPGTDAVAMFDPPSSADLPLLDFEGIRKLAGSAAGFPVAFPDPATVAGPGTGSGSSGVAVNGVTASTVHATTFGPGGASQIASATDIGGAVSENGGSSFDRVTYANASSVAWWRGASGTWLLFGQRSQSGNLAAGFLNWTPAIPAAVGGNVTGSSGAALGAVPAPVQTEIATIAGVPAQDMAFLRTHAPLPLSLPGRGFTDQSATVERVRVNPGPSFTDVTQIGRGVLDKPGPLAYCPAAGSASSAQDVLFVISQDGNGGALYRVTGATGSSPVVTKAIDLPAAAGTGGLSALAVDCRSGTVVAAAGNPGLGLLKSNDGAVTFSPVPVPLQGGSASIRAIALTPGDPNSMLVGDTAGFVQHTLDAGRTWTVVNDPATGVNLSLSANESGGLWDLATPAAPGVSHAALMAAVRTPHRLALQNLGTFLVAGPGEYAGHFAAPNITRLKLTNTRFAIGSQPTAVAAGTKRSRTPHGTQFVYSLSAPGTITILFARESLGHSAGGKCAHGTKASFRHQRCTMYTFVTLRTVGRLVGGRCEPRTSRNAGHRSCALHGLAYVTRRSRAGSNRLSFSGRIGHQPLGAGRYAALIAARDSTGQLSATRSTTFTVVAGR